MSMNTQTRRRFITAYDVLTKPGIPGLIYVLDEAPYTMYAWNGTSMQELGGGSTFFTPQAGTVNGTPQHVFTFSADTGQRLVGLAINVNAASDVQASEQIAAGQYTTYPLDFSGELVSRSPGADILRIAVVALASTTYAAGKAVAVDETTEATVLSALTFVLAPSAGAKYLVITSAPVYSGGVVVSSEVTIRFAEAA